MSTENWQPIHFIDSYKKKEGRTYISQSQFYDLWEDLTFREGDVNEWILDNLFEPYRPIPPKPFGYRKQHPDLLASTDFRAWLRLRQEIYVDRQGICDYCAKHIDGKFHIHHTDYDKGDDPAFLRLCHVKCHDVITYYGEERGSEIIRRWSEPYDDENLREEKYWDDSETDERPIPRAYTPFREKTAEELAEEKERLKKFNRRLYEERKGWRKPWTPRSRRRDE